MSHDANDICPHCQAAIKQSTVDAEVGTRWRWTTYECGTTAEFFYSAGLFERTKEKRSPQCEAAIEALEGFRSMYGPAKPKH